MLDITLLVNALLAPEILPLPKPTPAYLSGSGAYLHIQLYAIDAATEDEMYASGDEMDSWNHYDGLVL